MPPVRRCVFGCLTDGITLHNFPNPRRFPEQFKKWIELVGEPVEDLRPEEIFGKKKVCDLHFTIDDKNRNNRLNAIATPVPFPYQKRVKSHAKSNSVSTLNGQYLGISHCSIVEAINTSSMQLFVADAEHANVADTAGAASPREEAHFSTVPFAKNYSWQRPSEVISEDHDDVVPDTMSMYCEKEATDIQQDTTRKDELAKHMGFTCNVCRKAISGFRYTCVQCSDMDLCDTCEADKAHDEHYMLRVPTPKTAAEVHAVLVSIRRNLATLEPLIEITKGQNNDISRLSEASEVKSEIGDVEGMTAVGNEDDVQPSDKEQQQEKMDVGTPRPKKAKVASMVDDAVASTSHERDDGNEGQEDKPPPEGSSSFDLKIVSLQTQLDLPDDGDHSGSDELIIGDRSSPVANPNINQIRIRTVARRRRNSRAARRPPRLAHAARPARPPRPARPARPPRPARAPRTVPSGVPLLPPLPGLSINSLGRVRLVLRLPSSMMRQQSNRRA